ncbi:MAG: biotin--[acetyl-CoA-carboxylase] ligase [Actinobacteria bacterium]|nr:biotin--[acetyl-CoA-carboxylase] ligase [Actinomycetota bacterium]
MTSTDYNWPENWFVRRVRETGSTNTDLFADALAGAPSHSVLMADNQTAGRGRLDRTWEAKPGTNLLVSLLFRSEANLLTMWPRIVALAAAHACQKLISSDHVSPKSAPKVTLKWPNDLLIVDRKLGGMLCIGDRQKQFVVVGIGINVGWAPQEAVSLTEFFSEKSPSPVELLENMLLEITQIEKLNLIKQQEKYVALLATLGKTVRIELTNGAVITGIAENIDVEGRLVVVQIDDNSVRQVIDTGDVVHLRNADHG